MRFCRKNILLLIFSSFISVGWGQDCDEGFVWIDDPPLNEYNWDGYNCFYELDLNVLSEFIQLNSSLSGQHLDIGWQYWVNGRLEGLTLYALQLTSIPNNIGSLNNLTYLNLHFNQITNIPETIGELTQLTEIYLENNLFGTLPESIGNLTNLITLNINENQLTSIPENIGNLTGLEELLLYNNSLTSLPESICNIFSNLSQYDFSDNYICPPYPYCIENVGYQDTSECEEPDPEYDIELHIQNFEEDGTFELILVNNTDLIAFEFDIPGLSEPDWDFSDNFPTDGWMWAGYWLFYNLYNTPLPVGIYEINASGDLFNNEFCVDGSVFSNSTGEQITNVFFSECAFVECSNPGDINYDGAVDILDIVGFVNDILNPWISNELFHVCGDINEDDEYNILDIVMMVNMILGGTDTGTVTDIDGNVYTTIQIGEQLWMAENLKVTHFNNGDEIPTGYSASEWDAIWDDAYAVYDDDPSNAESYGNLYNWFAVDDSRGICPENYHIPTDDEWYILLEYLGGAPSGSGENWLIAGGKMKDVGTIEDGDGLWHTPNEGATNESGFTAIPAGFRLYDGQYYESGYYSIYWSSTAEYYSDAYFMWYLLHDDSRLYRGLFDSQTGLSIRCLSN